MDAFPQRKLHRLQNYDYSQNGCYFITICTFQRRNLLCTAGNAVPGVPPSVNPTEIGKIVLAAWDRMSEINPCVSTDSFCLMPNHIHGIVVINDRELVETAERRGRRSLPDIVRAFKSATTREFNRLVDPARKNALWQGSYYDEVIRNDSHLTAVRQYIAGNAARWTEDEYYTPDPNPQNI